ncbi:glutamyl-tRNA(gln) amidotransferase subunit A [Physcia stellaris]|nr:glutamyl-tRNA(gln) amidotransferase subunit A [Physcia stellaris]
MASLQFLIILISTFFFSPATKGQTQGCYKFDIREASVETVHNALQSGLTSCRDITEAFIARIEAYNPNINAVITLNPSALSIANGFDDALAAGNATGALFCIPILLKDNYDTMEMNTTAGCSDLAGSQPTVDAPVVVALKRAGAIILGKTNLHELALEGLSVSSLGGQTLNPYDLSRTPGGSSGGTGAAIAASFAVFGTGTDTVNSLRSPASANSLFSVRPTRGLISRSGIIPISYTQDAVGPIARNVEDLAIALTVMASVGYDANDNTTAMVPSSSIGVDYSTALHGRGIKGVRLGLIETFFNHTISEETTPVTAAVNATVSALTAAGATVIPISSSIYNSSAILEAYDTQRFEYRQQMNEYLARPSLRGKHPASLNDLYRSGKYLVIPAQYSYVNTALVSSTDNTTYATRKLGIQNLTLAVQTMFKQYSLDALIYPEQANLVVKIGAASQSGRNGILAAVTGHPVVTVPAGFSPATEQAPVGVPIGLEILGLPWSEAKLLNLAKKISEIRRVRKMPVLTKAAISASAIDKVPVIVPNTRDIPSSYPLGTIEGSI